MLPQEDIIAVRIIIIRNALCFFILLFILLFLLIWLFGVAPFFKVLAGLHFYFKFLSVGTVKHCHTELLVVLLSVSLPCVVF